jgi:hypothetical protein
VFQRHDENVSLNTFSKDYFIWKCFNNSFHGIICDCISFTGWVLGCTPKVIPRSNDYDYKGVDGLKMFGGGDGVFLAIRECSAKNTDF